MTTTTEHLKRLAEAATPGPWKYEQDGMKDSPLGDTRACYLDSEEQLLGQFHWKDENNVRFIAAANPATIKALCELVEQMGEALKGHVYYTRPIHQSTEALAAYEAFQKGEGK